MKLQQTETLTTQTLENINHLQIKSPAVGKANKIHAMHIVGRDSSVGIATGYGLNGPGIEYR